MVLTGIMCLLRFAYWIDQCMGLEINFPVIVDDFFYFIPWWFQFATFSLLALFYAQVVLGSDWKTRARSLYRGIWITTNTLLFLFTSFISLSVTGKIDDKVEYLAESIYLLYAAVMYLALAGLLAVYGVKFNQAVSTHRKLLPRSPKAFAIVNFVLVVVF